MLDSELCGEETLSAKIVSRSYDGRRPVYKVYLYNTNDESGESINYKLVSLGHAWVSATTELDVNPDSYDEMADQQDQLGKIY